MVCLHLISEIKAHKRSIKRENKRERNKKAITKRNKTEKEAAVAALEEEEGCTEAQTYRDVSIVVVVVVVKQDHQFYSAVDDVDVDVDRPTDVKTTNAKRRVPQKSDFSSFPLLHFSRQSGNSYFHRFGGVGSGKRRRRRDLPSDF